ncbi:hypothetical protein OCU04_006537 [Sclerotinia nivalis]|uniref:Transposase Tc1-like domain-containing protein n=1 Tax=Sclerotinia nivalis TaxID=352851 RepID=A0A9X0DHY3_9HELO|nr:hypothetical protein OCU04_006537 [Sclerotinia nivalis]
MIQFGDEDDNHQFHENWKTPRRSRIIQARDLGKSWGWIEQNLGIPRSTARSIIKSNSTRRTRKGKVYLPSMISVKEIRRIIRTIARNWTGRRMTFEQIKNVLGIQASVRTIRRELRRHGYRRCIIYSRPFISRV